MNYLFSVKTCGFFSCKKNTPNISSKWKEKKGDKEEEKLQWKGGGGTCMKIYVHKSI